MYVCIFVHGWGWADVGTNSHRGKEHKNVTIQTRQKSLGKLTKVLQTWDIGGGLSSSSSSYKLYIDAPL